ncbi:MAG: hypothetical protein ACREJ2_11630 [Planctomycetota bacterium]
MSATLRRQKLTAALEALRCAESNLDEAQEFADAQGDRPDVDGCLELAIVLTQQARSSTKWAATLLEDGAAVKAMP